MKLNRQLTDPANAHQFLIADEATEQQRAARLAVPTRRHDLVRDECEQAAWRLEQPLQRLRALLRGDDLRQV